MALDPKEIQNRIDALREMEGAIVGSAQKLTDGDKPLQNSGSLKTVEDLKAKDQELYDKAVTKAQLLKRLQEGEPSIGVIPAGSGAWSKIQESGNIFADTPVAEAGASQVAAEKAKGAEAVADQHAREVRERTGMMGALREDAQSLARGLVRGPAELLDTLTFGKTHAAESLSDSPRGEYSDLVVDDSNQQFNPLYQFLKSAAKDEKGDLTKGKAFEGVGQLASELMFLYAPLNRAIRATGVPALAGRKLAEGGWKKLGKAAEPILEDMILGGMVGAKDGWKSMLVNATLMPAAGIPLRAVGGAVSKAIANKTMEWHAPKYNYNANPSDNALYRMFAGTPDSPTQSTWKKYADKAWTDWVDDVHPLQQLSKTFFKETGRTLPIEQDPYATARMFNRMPFQITDFLRRKVKPVLKAVGEKDYFDFNMYLAARTMKDRIAANPDWAKSAAKRGITDGSLTETMKNIETHWGPEKAPKMQELAGTATKMYDDVSNLMVEGGLLSKEALGRMQEAQPNYVSLAKLVDFSDQYMKQFGTALRKFHAGSQDLFPRIKGVPQEATYVLPMDQMLQRIPKLLVALEQNKIAQQTVNFRKLLPDTYGTLIRPVEQGALLTDIVGEGNEALARRALRYSKPERFIAAVDRLLKREFPTGMAESIKGQKTARIPLGGRAKLFELQESARNVGPDGLKEIFDNAQRFKQISTEPVHPETGIIPVWQNGNKVDYYLPKEMADVVSSAPKTQVDFMGDMLKNWNEIFKASVTSFNPGFMVSNTARDFSTQLMNANNPIGPLAWMKGFYRAVKGATVGDELYDQARKYGVGTGLNTLSKDIHTLSKYTTIKDGKLEVGGLSKKLMDEGTVKNAIKAAFKPKTYLQFVETLNSFVEMAPRLGVMEKGIKRTGNPMASAWDARNATIDFYKAGLKGRLLNIYVPFFNARLQGTINTLGAMKRNPTRAAAVILSGAVIPEIAAYYWNTRMYPAWADQVSEIGSDNSLRLIVGEGTDKNGKPHPQIIDVPKGDYQRIFGKVAREAIKFLDDRDPESVEAIAKKIFDTLSPVSMVDSKGDLSAREFAANLSPPIARATAEVMTGKELRTGRMVEGGGLGYQTNLSPELHYIPGKTGKGAIAIGKLFKTSPELIEHFATEAFGIFGRAVTGPEKLGQFMEQRFYKTSANELTGKAIEAANKVENILEDKKQVDEIKAAVWVDMIKNSDLPTEKKMTLFKTGAKDPAIGKYVNEFRYKTVTPTYVRVLSKAGVDNGSRAAAIVTFLDTIKKDSPELREQVMNELATAKTPTGQKLITPEVRKQMQLLLELKTAKGIDAGKKAGKPSE